MSQVVLHPLPTPWSEEGLEPAVSDLVGCPAEWVTNHEVDVGRLCNWIYVHEFRLKGHPTAERCFVVRTKVDETWTYLKDDTVRCPDDAVRQMLSERRGS
jgi:hypothetical protein